MRNFLHQARWSSPTWGTWIFNFPLFTPEASSPPIEKPWVITLQLRDTHGKCTHETRPQGVPQPEPLRTGSQLCISANYLNQSPENATELDFLLSSLVIRSAAFVLEWSEGRWKHKNTSPLQWESGQIRDNLFSKCSKEWGGRRKGKREKTIFFCRGMTCWLSMIDRATQSMASQR